MGESSAIPFIERGRGEGKGRQGENGRSSMAITTSVSNENNGGKEKRKGSCSINARDERTAVARGHGASVPGVACAVGVASWLSAGWRGREHGHMVGFGLDGADVELAAPRVGVGRGLASGARRADDLLAGPAGSGVAGPGRLAVQARLGSSARRAASGSAWLGRGRRESGERREEEGERD
jgi:hypothetical protein